jgi:hypothetical protein
MICTVSYPRSGAILGVVLATLFVGPSRDAWAQSLSPPQVAFLENRGQWEDDTLFAGTIGEMAVQLHREAAFLCLRNGRTSSIVRLSFPNIRDDVTLDGVVQRTDLHNYLTGDIPARWCHGVAAYESVVYLEAWPGIDLYVSQAAGQLTVTLNCHAGVMPSAASIRVAGATKIGSDAVGGLMCETAAGRLHWMPLRCEQSAAGESVRPVAARYHVGGSDISFDTSGEDDRLPLVINFGLEWASFLGGTATDYSRGMTVGPTGKIYSIGTTHSLDFPLTPGAIDTTFAGINEVFLSCLDPSGSQLLYSTLLGGEEEETPRSVMTSADGDVTLFGSTRSADFPTTAGAYDTTLGGSGDLFVTRLSEDGEVIQWSTLLGDSTPLSFSETASDMVLGSDDSVYVLGHTQAVGYPVTAGAFDTTPDDPIQGHGDIVVSHISADGRVLLQSTFVGGAAKDESAAIALCADGVVLVGYTQSPDYPTTPGVFNPGPQSGIDGVVTKLDLNLSSLLFSTLLDGSSAGFGSRILDVAIDKSGNVTCVGHAGHATWPVTPGSYDVSWNGSKDAFITRLNPTGSSLVYSTFLGAGNDQGAYAVAVDAAGTATVAGFSWWSSAFPTTAGAFLGTGIGSFDTFVARLSPDGQDLWYSTLLGGLSGDSDSVSGAEIALLPDGSTIVAAFTHSADFPSTPGAYDTNLDGTTDAFIAKLSMLPLGVNRFGSSTPGCDGVLAMGVTAQPQPGKAFYLTCTNAPPSRSAGILALGLSDLQEPLMAKGAALWVNPAPLLLVIPWTSNTVGFASLGATLPNDPGIVGASFAVQSFWPDPCAVPGPLAASNALAITIQL